MLSKNLLALLLGLASSVASAASDYYVVVPLSKVVPGLSIEVDLGDAMLPSGVVGTEYPEVDFRPMLRVTGDPAFSQAAVVWEMVSGSLPAGLQLSAHGTLSGTPTAEGTGAFTLRARYKGKDGQAQYQLLVLNIHVFLDPLKLDPAIVGDSYQAVDFKDQLRVDGDPDFHRDDVTFSGINIPKGMALSPQGLFSGTPQAKAPQGVTFEVSAVYKSKTAQQSFTLVVEGVPLRVRQVASGIQHTCAVTDVGGVKCWGFNNAGQLGDGSLTHSRVPVDVVGLQSGVAKVYASTSYSCAITNAGAAKCWGSNDGGQLGTGTAGGNRLVPVDVAGLSSGVTSMSISWFHGCAVVSGGAKCWGKNVGNQLGDGTSADRLIPIDVLGHTNDVLDVAVGMTHSCLLTATGSVKCWGMSFAGALGDRQTALTPTEITGVKTGIIGLASNSDNVCALTSAGQVLCWGDNWAGQTGVDSNTASKVTKPSAVNGVAGAVELSVSQSSACALLNTQQVRCWGNNQQGSSPSHVPQDVSGMSDAVVQISVGGVHSCAVTSGGLLKCWGDNSLGQTGAGDANSSPVPTIVERPPAVDVNP